MKIASFDDGEFFSVKDIGFSLYSVTKDGRVKNNRTQYITRGSSNAEGYLIVSLVRDTDGKNKSISVHHLMALLFLGPKPGEQYTVDHIDQNRQNNIIENLRWATSSEQNINKHHPDIKSGTPVTQLSENYEGIVTWLNITYISDISGLNPSQICAACRNGKMYGGYYWKYALNSIIRNGIEEQWRELLLCESSIKVSNFGRIRFKNKITYGYDHNNYKKIQIKSKQYSVHRLVMLAFCGEDARPVNHKDGNGKNNNLDNLEYVTNLENSAHAVKNGLREYKNNGSGSKKVGQYSLDSILICEYPSLAEAKRATQIFNIQSVCKGTRQTAGGFIWKYI